MQGCAITSGTAGTSPRRVLRCGCFAALLAATLAGCGSSSDAVDDTAATFTQTVSFQTSDGEQLHAVVRGAGDLRARPLIIEFSPYGVGSDVPDFGPAYNHVYVNARGTGQSSGVWTAVGPDDQRDVSEFVAWACRQPWSNGHIGLYGFSASAIAIYNAMHLPLACVDAAALMAGTHRLYRDLLYPGGTLNLVPGAAVGLGVGTPIILGGFLNLLQKGQLPLGSVFSGVGFIGIVLQVLAHGSEDEFWTARSHRSGPNVFPVLADTGFYDVESRGPFESYRQLRADGVPVHLRVFGAHDGFPAGTPGPMPEYQRWFDRFLLGKDNGIDRDAPVQLLIGHGSYEAQIAGAVTRLDAADWPVPGTRWQALYLDPARGGGAGSLNDGRLLATPSASQTAQPYPALISLPTASEPNTTSVINRAGAGTLFEAIPFLTQLNLMEPLSLTYTAPAFSQDVDVVGPASLEIFVTTALPESDLHAVVADVWPDGSSHAVGIGRLRSSYPNLEAGRSRVVDGEIVQPYADHSSKTLPAPAEQRKYQIEFWPIGNRFEAGHRLRLYVLGAPAYELPAPSVNIVHVGGVTPSRLLLPVLPGSDACAAIGTPC